MFLRLPGIANSIKHSSTISTKLLIQLCTSWYKFLLIESEKLLSRILMLANLRLGGWYWYLPLTLRTLTPIGVIKTLLLCHLIEPPPLVCAIYKIPLNVDCMLPQGCTIRSPPYYLTSSLLLPPFFTEVNIFSFASCQEKGFSPEKTFSHTFSLKRRDVFFSSIFKFSHIIGYLYDMATQKEVIRMMRMLEVEDLSFRLQLEDAVSISYKIIYFSRSSHLLSFFVTFLQSFY